MISRRRILSRSSDVHRDCDVWCDKNKLFVDHIHEILNKWEQIDEDIWAKIIFMEKNRRVAKAYARSPVITINGSNHGFNGYTVGLGGFKNVNTEESAAKIYFMLGEGIKLKIDEKGHFLIKKLEKCNTSIKTWLNEKSNSIGKDILDSQGSLVKSKAMQIFDMKKFQLKLSLESKKPYPNRNSLELECISCILLGDDKISLLENSCWIMIINIVALEMIKFKFEPKVTKLTMPNYSPISKNNGFQESNQVNHNYLWCWPDKQKMFHLNLNLNNEFKDEQMKVNSNFKFKVPKPDYDREELKIVEKLEDEREIQEKRTQSITFHQKFKKTFQNYYRQCVPVKRCDYLNSAMRKLPINSRLSSCSSSDSSQTDSEAPYYHVYSSILEGIKVPSLTDQKNHENCEKIVKFFIGKWE